MNLILGTDSLKSDLVPTIFEFGESALLFCEKYILTELSSLAHPKRLQGATISSDTGMRIYDR